MKEQEEIEFTARLNGGGGGEKEGEVDEVVVTYKIRGLKNNDEVKEWAKFCASIFSYKSNPPPSSYFERHYFNDPQGRNFPRLIRVAFLDGKMVASCRLFLRTISSGGIISSSTTINTNSSINKSNVALLAGGGIGEVCTDSKHRRRGLSKALLQNVIEIMKERELSVSLLHAAPQFFNVYGASGYVCSKSQWSVVTIRDNTNTNTNNTNNNYQYSIRQAKFPTDTNRLHSLHQTYSEQNFVGCIVRSIEYWNEYLSYELKDSLWVVVVEDNNNNSSSSDLIVAWLSIRPRGGNNRFQLREFGIDNTKITTAKALDLLLLHAIMDNNNNNNNNNQVERLDEEKQNLYLILPTVVLDQAQEEENNNNDTVVQCLDCSTKVSEDDLGWMYKIFHNNNNNNIQLEDINGEKRPHLIWPSDSF